MFKWWQTTSSPGNTFNAYLHTLVNMYDGGMNLWYEDFFFLSVYMYRKTLKLCLGHCKNFINTFFLGRWKNTQTLNSFNFINRFERLWKGNEYVIMYYRTNAICGLLTSSFVFWKFRLGKTTEKSFICQYGEYMYTITGMPKIFLHNNRHLAHKLISTLIYGG